MEKQITQVSYWLGLACALIGIVWKVLEILKLMPESYGTLMYSTVYKGGLLLLVVVIATASWAAVKSPKA